MSHSEEEQIQQIKDWWKENGKSIMFGVAASLAIVFGWRGWQSYETSINVAASELYDQYLVAIESPESSTEKNTTTALTELKTNYPSSSYAAYATLIQAKQFVDAQKWSDAETELKWIVEKGAEKELVDLATLRLVRVHIEQKNYSEADQLLNTNPDNQFVGQYWEIKGDLALAKGELEQAKAAYKTARSGYEESSTVPQILELKIADLAHIQIATMEAE